ncbi:class III poly(R)-hydroxyalkanoic acid synthase subunit PhaE [Spirulina subsalsa FACHB-351]|uniref:Poly(3-hydroxyalkanoate) polymerase subunit PhaE n=2 Tax=Spirulina subsalsa TaxID=54311 RepID=A0ABT3L1F2_9CYAN|nr:class III poly(R)-hydroxyalkanoic acid synthase subunit PhaE [Spirulina subsalsa FACHB-351]
MTPDFPAPPLPTSDAIVLTKNEENIMTNNNKNWSNMASEVVNTWTETSTQVWRNWFDFMGTVSTAKPFGDVQPELDKFTHRYLDNQDLWLRFVKLSFDAWKDIFPQLESGGDWTKTMSQYAQKMREQLDNVSHGNLQMNQDVAQMWQLYLQQVQKFTQLWLDPMGLHLGTMGKAATGNSSAWIELNNLYWNLFYEESFGSLMQSPILGPTREFNGKLVRSFEAWKNLNQASVNYQVVLADIQVRSFEALMQNLISRAEKGEAIQTWKQFQQVWSEIADDVFGEAFCQEENLKIRGAFLNALSAYRLEQQQLMELFLQSMNMPLRSEVDEMHKTIYELRKELKQLKKDLAQKNVQQEVTSSSKGTKTATTNKAEKSKGTDA